MLSQSWVFQWLQSHTFQSWCEIIFARVQIVFVLMVTITQQNVDVLGEEASVCLCSKR